MAMSVRVVLSKVLFITAVFAWPSSVSAERAWSGSIHFVDANIRFGFGGMEHGYWSDFGYLKFPGNPSRGGDINGLVRYRFLPDQNDPLRSTIKGTIRLEVDGRKAELKQLVLVRPGPASDWRIDPKIIERLKNDEELKRDSIIKSKGHLIDREESPDDD